MTVNDKRVRPSVKVTNAHLPPDGAEEAVNEVKRQAMDEVQKAVAEAEQKAFEMIAAERAKMEKTLAEAKRKAQEDAIMIINEQEDSSEVSNTAENNIIKTEKTRKALRG